MSGHVCAARVGLLKGTHIVVGDHVAHGQILFDAVDGLLARTVFHNGRSLLHKRRVDHVLQHLFFRFEREILAPIFLNTFLQFCIFSAHSSDHVLRVRQQGLLFLKMRFQTGLVSLKEVLDIGRHLSQALVHDAAVEICLLLQEREPVRLLTDVVGVGALGDGVLDVGVLLHDREFLLHHSQLDLAQLFAFGVETLFFLLFVEGLAGGAGHHAAGLGFEDGVLVVAEEVAVVAEHSASDSACGAEAVALIEARDGSVSAAGPERTFRTIYLRQLRVSGHRACKRHGLSWCFHETDFAEICTRPIQTLSLNVYHVFTRNDPQLAQAVAHLLRRQKVDFSNAVVTPLLWLNCLHPLHDFNPAWSRHNCKVVALSVTRQEHGFSNV